MTCSTAPGPPGGHHRSMTHITSTDQRQPLAPATDLGPLRSTFAGEILTPADGDQYDDARVVFNAMFDRRPAAIAGPRATATL